jgi:hypothetical protein
MVNTTRKLGAPRCADVPSWTSRASSACNAWLGGRRLRNPNRPSREDSAKLRVERESVVLTDMNEQSADELLKILRRPLFVPPVAGKLPCPFVRRAAADRFAANRMLNLLPRPPEASVLFTVPSAQRHFRSEADARGSEAIDASVRLVPRGRPPGDPAGRC